MKLKMSTVVETSFLLRRSYRGINILVIIRVIDLLLNPIFSFSCSITSSLPQAAAFPLERISICLSGMPSL